MNALFFSFARTDSAVSSLCRCHRIVYLTHFFIQMYFFTWSLTFGYNYSSIYDFTLSHFLFYLLLSDTCNSIMLFTFGSRHVNQVHTRQKNEPKNDSTRDVRRLLSLILTYVFSIKKIMGTKSVPEMFFCWKIGSHI